MTVAGHRPSSRRKCSRDLRLESDALPELAAYFALGFTGLEIETSHVHERFAELCCNAAAPVFRCDVEVVSS
jgi:hypothetical protein